jgi:class 3 adenylate cyclase/DNA-binding beta-propeller fold protein YncE
VGNHGPVFKTSVRATSSQAGSIPVRLRHQGILPFPDAVHDTEAMRRKPAAAERRLLTVLFTDIVGSTDLAAKLGDQRWRQLLGRHHALVRRELKRHRGREVDTTGDGFFAVFQQPARAVECALALSRRLPKEGIQIRAGIHMGEVEVVGPNYEGIGVHIGARVMSLAGAGDVIVSRTVRDSMAGSNVRFLDRGEHELKGVPGSWHLYAVEAEATEEEEVGQDEGAGRREPGPARWPLVVAGLALVVTGAAVALVVVRSGGAGSAPPKIRPNTLVRLNLSSGELVSVVPVGTDPNAVASGPGALWVTNLGDQTLQRIDISSGTASPARALPELPTAVAVGGDRVWVASSFGGTVHQIDPTQALSGAPIDVGSGAAGIAFGEDAVWVTDSHTNSLLRIDRQTREIVERFPLAEGSGPSGVAVGFGSVWVAEPLAGRLEEIDLTGQVVGTTPLLEEGDLPGTSLDVAVGEGYVWVAVQKSDTVMRIDPDSNRGQPIRGVGNGPAGIAVGEGYVWVANSLDGTVARIDPRSNTVTRYPVGFRPSDVAVAGGSVWVSIGSS